MIDIGKKKWYIKKSFRGKKLFLIWMVRVVIREEVFFGLGLREGKGKR